MRIAIVGGGISGLVTAYRLSRSKMGRDGKLDIRVYEASDRLGGVIQSERQDDFLFERGPDSFITAKPWAVELCRELGLDKSFIETNPNFRKSFILSSNKLIPVPRGFYLMAPTKVSEAMRTPLLSLRGKIRMACELFIPPRKEGGDESLASFVRRRFGQEVLDRIAQPMIAGIYTADPEELSLEATFPHFLKMEKEHGSVIRALTKRNDAATSKASGPRYSLFLSLKRGLSELVTALTEKMPQVHFCLSTKITRLEKREGWKLFAESGDLYEADVVCLALPATASARLLNPLNDALTKELRRIPYERVATVNLVYFRKDIQHALNGLGYVVPTAEKKFIVGCTFSSIKYPGRSRDDRKVLLRVFLGGKASRDLLGRGDREVIRAACNEIREQLEITAEPCSSVISRWTEAIPQYCVGHRQTVNRISNELGSLPGMYLTGNAYGGTGIPDCIHHASQTAAQILNFLATTKKRQCAEYAI